MYNYNIDITDEFFEGSLPDNSFNINNIESNGDLFSIHSYSSEFDDDQFLYNIISFNSNAYSNITTSNNINNIKNRILFQVKMMKRIRRKNKRKFSRKYDKDDIIRKIKVNYIKFIIDLLNQILFLKKRLTKNNKYFNLKFYYLDYEYSKNIKKDCLDNLVNLTIENVIISNISGKYKNIKSNSNEETCKIIKQEKELKEIATILDQKFPFFFEKLYVEKKKSKCNLKELGLMDLEIDLSKIQLFEDLLSKNKENKYYIEKLKFYKNDLFKKPYIFKIHNDI